MSFDRQRVKKLIDNYVREPEGSGNFEGLGKIFEGCRTQSLMMLAACILLIKIRPYVATLKPSMSNHINHELDVKDIKWALTYDPVSPAQDKEVMGTRQMRDYLSIINLIDIIYQEVKQLEREKALQDADNALELEPGQAE